MGSGNVKLDPEKLQYNKGEVVALNPVPEQGYLFKEWSGTNGNEIIGNNLTMDGNKQVTAVFIPTSANDNIPSFLDLEIPDLTTQEVVSEITTADGWNASYFIPPARLLSPAHLFINSQGEFVTNEIATGSLIKITKEGDINRFFDASGNSLFTIAMDASDNVYIWDNHQDGTARLLKVDSSGNSCIELAKGTSINSDWDTGVFASSPSGEIYMYTRHGENNQLIKVDQEGNVQLIKDIQDTIHIGNMFFDTDGNLFVTKGTGIYQMDTETGEVGNVIYDTNWNPELDMHGLIHIGFFVDKDGSFYISDGTKIEKIDSEGNSSIIARDFSIIRGIAVDEQGIVYTISRKDGGLYKITNNSIDFVVVPGSLNMPERMSFNSKDELYVYQRESLCAGHFNSNGDLIETFTDLNIFPPLGDIEVDENDNIWVTSSKIPGWPNLPMQLIMIDSNGKDRRVVVDNFSEASALDVFNQNLYVGEISSNKIYIVSETGEIQTYIDEIENPLAFDFDSEGNLYVLNGHKLVYLDKIDTDKKSSRIITLSIETEGSFTDIVVSSNGRIFALAGFRESECKVYEILGVNEKREIASGFKSALGIAIDNEDDLYVSDAIYGFVIKLEESFT